MGDLEDLVLSIKTSGLLCPIIIRPLGSFFEVVAGNRRFEACKRLHKTSIPCIVRTLTDKEAYELSIVENMQRLTLSVIEEATAYKKYADSYGWGSVKELAAKLGKSTSYISHRISLLELPDPILEKLRQGEISQSIATELIWVSDKAAQLKLSELSGQGGGLTVADVRAVRKRRSDDEKDDPFVGDWVRSTPPGEIQLIDKAILSMRIAMVRIDSFIERSKSEDTQKCLIQARLGLHRIIDETMSRKKTL